MKQIAPNQCIEFALPMVGLGPRAALRLSVLNAWR